MLCTGTHGIHVNDIYLSINCCDLLLRRIAQRIVCVQEMGIYISFLFDSPFERGADDKRCR